MTTQKIDLVQSEYEIAMILIGVKSLDKAQNDFLGALEEFSASVVETLAVSIDDLRKAGVEITADRISAILHGYVTKIRSRG